jgi:superfamily II DNA or RNA helicase
MSLADLLQTSFRADIRFRGDAYLKADRVAITRVTSDELFGVVRDGVEYQTTLTRNDGELKMYCNCEQMQKTGVCKHLWATILAVDEEGCLSATTRPGHVPPFTTEPSSFPLVFDDDEEGFEAETGLPHSSGTLNRAEAPTRTLRPWEVSLTDVRADMAGLDAKKASVGRDREVFYEIDANASREAGRLIVQTSQRQRRANGQWGKLKPLKLRHGEYDELEHADDRAILAYMFGGAPERSNWYAQQAETQTLVYRYRVAYELCELILPMMCRTGRVRFQGDHEKKPKPLEWDDGAPWELSLCIEQNKQTSEWVPFGRLRRDGETLPIQAAELLLPGGLVVTGGRIGRLQDFGAFEWVKLLSRKEPLAIPDGEQNDFVDHLLDMPVLPRLELPEELRLEEVVGKPEFHLTLRSPRSGRWHLERLTGQVQFEYLGTRLSGSSAQWAIVQREEGRCILRDREAETQAWGTLQECGFRRLIDRRRDGQDVEVAARELGPAVRRLIDLGWQVHADGQRVRQPQELKFQLKSGIDWFELHANVQFEHSQVSFPELLSALARGDTTVRLDDGSLGILPEEWARKVGLLGGLGVVGEDHVRFEHNQVAMLDALLSAQESVDFDDQFIEMRDKFRAFSGVVSVTEPEGFKGELREYQRTGLGWLDFLQQFGFGGCLADDMGLGKTVQLIALLLERCKTRKKPMPSLIVVPKSLMFNWHQECERFAPQLKVMEYTGLDRAKLLDDFPNQDIVLATYGTVRRDILQLQEIEFDYIVLDEAQMVKNSGSQVAKASRLLKAKHRVALSGTPIENHLGDLWSIFEFLNPGMLGRSSVFKTYAADIEDKESRKLLSTALQPFILRRTKAQVASELPEKIEQTIYCDMSDDQRKMYDELREHYRNSLLGMVHDQGLGKSKMHVLEALLRLRQAACHPGLLNKSKQDDPSAKLDVLIPHIEELIAEGHKALVFSQFTSMLSIVRRHLDRRNIVYEYLDGQTRNRKDHIERFQDDPDCPVFLISLKAGGLGLNLTAADYVFLLDPWWNPAVEAQAIDRAHRVGQTRQVMAYRLICRDTVEEKIAKLQSKKRSLVDAILTVDKNLLRELSTEDLEMLLS